MKGKKRRKEMKNIKMLVTASVVLLVFMFVLSISPVSAIYDLKITAKFNNYSADTHLRYISSSKNCLDAYDMPATSSPSDYVQFYSDLSVTNPTESPAYPCSSDKLSIDSWPGTDRGPGGTGGYEDYPFVIVFDKSTITNPSQTGILTLNWAASDNSYNVNLYVCDSDPCTSYTEISNAQGVGGNGAVQYSYSSSNSFSSSNIVSASDRTIGVTSTGTSVKPTSCNDAPHNLPSSYFGTNKYCIQTTEYYQAGKCPAYDCYARAGGIFDGGTSVNGGKNFCIYDAPLVDGSSCNVNAVSGNPGTCDSTGTCISNTPIADVVKFRVVISEPVTGAAASSSSGGSSPGSSTLAWTKTIDATQSTAAAQLKSETGYSAELGSKQRLEINTAGETHYVGVTSLAADSSYADVQIASTPITIRFNIGDEKKIDLNNNNYYDLFIKLNSIINKKANLTIKTINELISAQNASSNQAQGNTDLPKKDNILTAIPSTLGLNLPAGIIIFWASLSAVLIIIVVILLLIFIRRRNLAQSSNKKRYR